MGKNFIDSHTSLHTEKRCSQIFKLQSKSNKVFIQVDFSPVKAISELQGEKALCQFSIIPRFNADRKFYSEAFYNPFQGLQKDGNLLVKHEQRVKEISTQIPQDSILMPKPRRKDHCWVCQTSFNDYLQHIKSQDHSQSVKASYFNNDIIALAQQYEQKTQKQKRPTKTCKSGPKKKSKAKKGKLW